MNFGLGDMNSYTHDAVYVHLAPPAPVKVGCGKGRPVKIITDNIPHPCKHTVPQLSVVESSSINMLTIFS